MDKNGIKEAYFLSPRSIVFRLNVPVPLPQTTQPPTGYEKIVNWFKGGPVQAPPLAGNDGETAPVRDVFRVSLPSSDQQLVDALRASGARIEASAGDDQNFLVRVPLQLGWHKFARVAMTTSHGLKLPDRIQQDLLENVIRLVLLGVLVSVVFSNDGEKRFDQPELLLSRSLLYGLFELLGVVCRRFRRAVQTASHSLQCRRREDGRPVRRCCWL